MVLYRPIWPGGSAELCICHVKPICILLLHLNPNILLTYYNFTTTTLQLHYNYTTTTHDLCEPRDLGEAHDLREVHDLSEAHDLREAHDLSEAPEGLPGACSLHDLLRAWSGTD